MGRVISNIILPIIMHLPRFLYFNLLLIHTKVLCVENVEHKSFNNTLKVWIHDLNHMIYFSVLSLIILSCFSSEKECARMPMVMWMVFILLSAVEKLNHCLSAHILSEKYLSLLKASSVGDGELRQLLCMRWPCP